MNILLTNDDGYFSDGIKAMALELISKGHDVTIVAPSKEHSGKSHAISLKEDLIMSPVQIDGLNIPCYSVSGTPVDCVRAAFNALETKFDFCFSGCNVGYNAGMDIVYSGTVSAAFEANMYGISSIAISSGFSKNGLKHETSAQVASEVFEKIYDKLDSVQLININVPCLDYSELKGIKLAVVGTFVTDLYNVEKENDTFRFNLCGRSKPVCAQNSDRFLLKSGYATVTPIQYSLTNTNFLTQMENYL